MLPSRHCPECPQTLVRDHARGIIELAENRGALPDDVPLARARPPYPRGAPIEEVSRETLGSYVQDYGGHLLPNDIRSSAVEDGDFARYEIDPLGGQFLLLPREEFGRSMREIYEDWHAHAIAPFSERQVALDRVIEIAGRLSDKPFGSGPWDRHTSANGLLEARDAIEAERDAAIDALERLLTEDEIQEFRIRAAGYLRGRMWDERAPAWHPTYAGKLSRHWVAWRAHELGWTSERFGEFERRMASRGRMEHRIERIGKKYQWIAQHELTGRLSDIALVDGFLREDPELYRGPWQVGTREMDPTILVTRTKQHDSDRQGATWWSPHASRWRDDPPEARIAWMEDRTRDIPDPAQQIDVRDPDGRRWLVLDTNVGRNQWVMVDGERRIHRVTWHKVKSMLVASADVNRLERFLRCSEHGRDHPPDVDMPQGGYLGEYPWHPAFTGIDDGWVLGARGAIPVNATVANWYVERSGPDYSVEESFNLSVPSPALIRGLKLRLAEGRSLAYAAADSRILFKDPSADELGFSAAVVDYDSMRAFLDTESLEIVWTFTGEKSAHGGRRHRDAWGGMLEYWGIYRFDGGSIRGALNFDSTNATSEQFADFLANP